MRRKLSALILLLCLGLLLSGCAQFRPEPTPTPTPEPTPIPTAVFPDGAEYPETAEELDLSGTAAENREETLRLLEKLPALRRVDLGDERVFTPQQVLALQAERPELILLYRVSLGGETCSLQTREADLSAVESEAIPAVLERLPLLKKLRTVELGEERENGPTWAQIAALEQAAPEATFRYRFTLYGKPFTLQSEEMDINHTRIEDDGALVREVIACMPRLRYLCMDSCHVDNEHMAAIRDDFPAVEVVWRIWFGTGYSVRTNVTKILASRPDVAGNISSKEADETLIYCTKLKYLDLGHNQSLRDIEFLRAMPDMEALILAMNHLGDLGPLADCHKLEYLELFLSEIDDLTPLKDLSNLRHLNIGMCPYLTDLTPLYGLELERLFIGTGTNIPQEQIDEYKRLHPDCEVDDTHYDTTNASWRYTTAFDEDPDYMAKDYYYPGLAPRYALLRVQFGYHRELSEYSYSWLDPDI